VDHKTEATIPQGLLGLRETFEHECIVPDVRLGIIFSQSEADDDGQGEVVRFGNGEF
jgi:hypothetical protein